MAANIVTIEDLQNLKQELVAEVQKLLQEHVTPTRKWLKSREVMKFLMISPTTLQNLRINGSLPYTKIGGTYFYAYNDIQNMIEKHKQSHEFPSRET